MIKIEIVSALTDNYIYIIHNEVDNLTAVIDPGDPFPVINKLEEKKWKLNQIINTHHHDDHTLGNKELINYSGAELFAPLYDKERIDNVNHFVSDKDSINIAGINSLAISTPGHTLGHICYYLNKENILFSGDTLFRLGCGRVFEGTMKQMKESLEKIKALPNNTKVYCGHEYTLSNAKFCLDLQPKNKKFFEVYNEILELRNFNTPTVPFTLDEEKKINPFLMFDNQAFKKSLNLENQNGVEVFKYIRNKKDNF